MYYRLFSFKRKFFLTMIKKFESKFYPLDSPVSYNFLVNVLSKTTKISSENKQPHCCF